MGKKAGSGSRSKSAGKIEALRRAQQINELLMRSTIESEALQSSSDDRPVGEQHIFDLLDQDRSERRLQNVVSKNLGRRRPGMHRRVVKAKPKKAARKRRR
jgi:hypothetical protein